MKDGLCSAQFDLGDPKVAVSPDELLFGLFISANRLPEVSPGTTAASGASTMVTSAPRPTISYKLMISLERIRIHP